MMTTLKRLKLWVKVKAMEVSFISDESEGGSMAFGTASTIRLSEVLLVQCLRYQSSLADGKLCHENI